MAESQAVTDIKEAIATNATDGISTATSDGLTVTKMSVDEQIKAANYLAANGAASKPRFGLRFTKMIPPGGG